MTSSVVLSVRLPRSTKFLLHATAMAKGQSESALVREIVEAVLTVPGFDGDLSKLSIYLDNAESEDIPRQILAEVRALKGGLKLVLEYQKAFAGKLMTESSLRRAITEARTAAGLVKKKKVSSRKK